MPDICLIPSTGTFPEGSCIRLHGGVVVALDIAAGLRFPAFARSASCTAACLMLVPVGLPVAGMVALLRLALPGWRCFGLLLVGLRGPLPAAAGAALGVAC